MDAPIRFCRTTAGTRVAYQVIGAGPTLVFPAWWYNHLEVMWENPHLTTFFTTLARNFTVVLYDRPGCGLSDRESPACSLEEMLAALTAVIDQLDAPHLGLFGFSQGGPVAVGYAVAHPEQVARLLLYSTQARWLTPPDPEKAAATWAAVKALIRADWGVLGSSALGQFAAPGTDPQILAWEARLKREAVDPEVAIAMLEAFAAIDVRPLLGQVQAPTLVLHRRGDTAMPFAAGLELAAGIPGARFVPLGGSWHAFYERDEQDVLPHVVAHLEDRDDASVTPLPFPDAVRGLRMAESSGTSTAVAYPDGLTPREVEVLRLIAAGQSNAEIAATLVIAEGTVERHVTNLYGKIGARGRADATAYAFRHQLAETRSA
jgi:pimeloyl-ACP methyl ester carboxylesterase/DNA-binding CsgD family transcriptional regulator